MKDSTKFAVLRRELAALREVRDAIGHAISTLSFSMGCQMNKYCKVNTLPTEILREILLSACEYGLRRKGLANIIKTCKQWYNIPLLTVRLMWGRSAVHTVPRRPLPDEAFLCRSTSPQLVSFRSMLSCSSYGHELIKPQRAQAFVFILFHAF